MSILNCHTRLSIVNCTGLPTTLTIVPKENHMRIQPLEQAHVNATVATSATSLVEWFHEWVQLVSYGPTYNHLEWSVAASSSETIRLQCDNPLTVTMNWSDASVSWEKHVPGKWSVDIRKAVDVTLYLRADMGEYVKHRPTSGPAAVKAIQLKPYLELACDDEIPFLIEKEPVANMYWSPQINLQQIVNPQCN